MFSLSPLPTHQLEIPRATASITPLALRIKWNKKVLKNAKNTRLPCHLASVGNASAGPSISAASCKLSKKW